MKTIKCKNRIGLFAGIVLIYFGMQISCTPDQPFDRIAKVSLQIPLPEPNNLKSATSISGVAGVTVTVTIGDEILAEAELTVSGNTASGVIVISPGENRTFTVKARDEEDIVQWQGSTTLDVVDDFTVNIVLAPILPEASVLQASNTENSVNLSWTQSSDNDFLRYELHRSASENDLGDNLFSTNAIDETAFIDTLIAEGQSFFYTLIVFDTEEFSANSNVAQVDMPIIYPMPISLLLISNDSNRVRLSWTQNTDIDFAGYELQRSLSASETGESIFSSSIAIDTLFEDIQVTEGITYYYTCVATDTAGFSTSSNQIQVDMPLIDPTPTILDAVYDGVVYITWTENPDSDFAAYELFRSESISEPGESIFSSRDVSKTEFTDEDVTGGKTYYYKIIVFDAEGLSAESNVIQIEVPGIPPTPVPLDGYHDGYLYLYWEQNSDADFARYELFRSRTGDDPWENIHSTPDISETDFIDEKATAGNTYHYKVIVFNAEGLSAESNVVQIEVPGIPPTPVRLDGYHDGYLYLYWEQNRDADFARYELYRSRTGDDPWENIHSTPAISETDFIDEKATAGNSYYYKVIVFDTEGLSAESNVVQIEVPGIPPTPVRLDGYHEEYLYLYWDQNSDADFARYELFRSQNEDNPWESIYSTPEISETDFIDEKAMAGNIYYYMVIVFDTEGLSAESNVVQVEVPGTPPTPVKLEGFAEGAYVDLYWEENIDDDFERYDLYRSQSINLWGQIVYSFYEVSDTYFFDEEVSEGNAYYYRIVVYDTEELYAESNIVEVIIEEYPPNPVELKGEYQMVDSVMMIQLSWSENNDLDFNYYELYRSDTDDDIGMSIFSTYDSTITYYENTDIGYNNTYYYTIVVYDKSGLSTNSNVVQISTPYFNYIAEP